MPAVAPSWAKEKYHITAKPQKVDALEFYPQNLDHLKEDMADGCRALGKEYLPAAFVTFK
jgi:hypothetical protein